MVTEMNQLQINSNTHEVENYLNVFDIWCLTRSYLDEKKIVDFFPHFIDKLAYGVVRSLVLFSSAKRNTSATIRFGQLFSSSKSQIHCTGSVRISIYSGFSLHLQTETAEWEHDIQLENQLYDQLSAGTSLPELQQKFFLHPD
ncbi:hypothetical protein PHET_05288 [Paragonimus heterotremus]|uniref:Uncharacterized protein n=1 Tax=Paragonimus heterotremus TaxID=100268 RepID=A0A8J4SPU3_9TREM|nr:hypothetical protein PHET_05288 [Paragonimus heterotremus]